MRATDDILKKAKQLPAKDRWRIVSALTKMDLPPNKARRKTSRRPQSKGNGWALWDALAGKGHEGTVLEPTAADPGDNLSPRERAALHRSLRLSLKQAGAGETRPGSQLLKKLRGRQGR